MSCLKSCGRSTSISAVATEICMRVSQGSDTEFECTLTDDQGEPIDITLDTVTFTAWDFIGGTQQILKTNLPGAHSDPVNGCTVFSLLISDYPTTSNLLSWAYEVKRIQSGGEEAIHIEGELLASPAGN